MKKLLLVALLPVWAWGYGVSVDASVNNIPTSYSTAAGSKVIVCGNSNVIQIVTTVTVEQAVSFQNPDSAPSVDHSFVQPSADGTAPAYTYISLKGGAGNNTAIYIRSLSGSAISSGKTRVACWNEETP